MALTATAAARQFREQNHVILTSSAFCHFANQKFDGGQRYMSKEETELALRWFENLQFNQGVIEELDAALDDPVKAQQQAVKLGALRKVGVGCDVVYLKKAKSFEPSLEQPPPWRQSA